MQEFAASGLRDELPKNALVLVDGDIRAVDDPNQEAVNQAYLLYGTDYYKAYRDLNPRLRRILPFPMRIFIHMIERGEDLDRQSTRWDDPPASSHRSWSDPLNGLRLIARKPRRHFTSPGVIGYSDYYAAILDEPYRMARAARPHTIRFVGKPPDRPARVLRITVPYLHDELPYAALLAAGADVVEFADERHSVFYATPGFSTTLAENWTRAEALTQLMLDVAVESEYALTAGGEETTVGQVVEYAKEIIRTTVDEETERALPWARLEEKLTDWDDDV
jgi:hypothetical protein